MKELWLAFEGGGTKTRALLGETDGTVVAREVGGSSSGLYIRRGLYVRNMRFLLRRVKRAADVAGGRVTMVGLGAPMVLEIVRDLIQEVFGPVECVVMGEGQIALAMHGLEWGVAVTAGTGASCWALNEWGEAIASGGFGPQFGDEGSGYWIGREAIAAAMRSRDGRERDTVLRARLCDFYGLNSINEILRLNDYSGHVAGPRVAACVPEVFRAAREGDEVALGVCRGAGRVLGELVNATAAKLSFEGRPVPVVLTGGVFNGGPLVIEPLKAALDAGEFEFEVYPEITEPGEGILRVMRMRLEEKRDAIS